MLVQMRQLAACVLAMSDAHAPAMLLSAGSGGLSRCRSSEAGDNSRTGSARHQHRLARARTSSAKGCRRVSRTSFVHATAARAAPHGHAAASEGRLRARGGSGSVADAAHLCPHMVEVTLVQPGGLLDEKGGKDVEAGSAANRSQLCSAPECRSSERTREHAGRTQKHDDSDG